MEKHLRMSVVLIGVGLILLTSSAVAFSYVTDASKDVLTGDSEWRLLVDGEVSHPLNLTFEEIQAMQNSTVFAQLWCYYEFVTMGNWTGVRLGLLLEQAGPYAQAIDVTLHASDGYAITLPMKTALRDDVIVAYEKDGESLPEGTRLVIPRENGDQWISMITEITIGAVPSISEFPLFAFLLLPIIGVAIAVFLLKRLRAR